MSEAIIVEAIQKLERFVVDTPSYSWLPEEVIDELTTTLDFLRDKKPEDRRRLSCLLADFAEMTQLATDLTTNFNEFFFRDKMTKALDWLRKTKMRIMEFGAGEGLARPPCVGGEGVVVGLEKDVQQFISRVILNENASLVTSCIKGMVGAGKTTLARQVYNHPGVVEKFKHRRAWITLSPDTSMREVLVELVKQLDGDSMLLEDMDNRSIQQMIRQHLQRMSYFIVLDNMLPEMRLESLLEGILVGHEGHGSRLLLISRIKIARVTYIYYTHEMKALDSDKSWLLFVKTIHKFTSDEYKFSKELERKGKELLKKCGGLPIAIIDVARQKAKQRLSGIEWEELFDSIDLGESLKLLEPMYHQLDERLKACFLHMSFFKENAMIREERLEHIWEASGLNTRSRQPLAYQLFSHSIIEVDHPYPGFSEVKRCRMNPLLRMLSIKKAEEEMGFEILSSNGNNRPSQSPRHRVIHCGREKFNHSTNQDNNHLVSLIFHGGGRYLDDASQSYWKSFELLKILDMEDFGVKTLSETMGTLIELRYLGLRNNYIQEIPHSLLRLEKLEVLDITLNFLVEVPDIIKDMSSLRHLYMSDVIYRKPLEVDALYKLRTLTYISIYDWTYEVLSLENLTRLYKLGIEEIDENANVSKLSASLAKLKNLQRLNLRGFRFRSMPCLNEIGAHQRLHELRVEGLIHRLPSDINNLYFVSCLILVNTCVDEDPMPLLEELPYLNRLKLQNAFTGRKMVIQRRGFPKLEVLCINELWNLRTLQVGEDAMWSLKQLEIKNCPRLKSLPEAIGSIKFLTKFKMVTTKHIATKIRNSSLLSKIAEVDIHP